VWKIRSRGSLRPRLVTVTLSGGDGIVLKQSLMDGRPTADAAAFASFSVPLAPREVVLLHIEPVKP